jgi:hypothetical protein
LSSNCYNKDKKLFIENNARFMQVLIKKLLGTRTAKQLKCALVPSMSSTLVTSLRRRPGGGGGVNVGTFGSVTVGTDGVNVVPAVVVSPSATVYYNHI